MTHCPRPILDVSILLAMPLAEFERCFGWRPEEAIEKYYYAEVGVRMDKFAWEMWRAGLMEHIKLEGVVME